MIFTFISMKIKSVCVYPYSQPSWQFEAKAKKKQDDGGLSAMRALGKIDFLVLRKCFRHLRPQISIIEI